MPDLYDFQNELVDRTRRSWATWHKRPCIVLPCGGGKSVIAAEIAKRTTQAGNQVLFIVHRKELCDQIRNTFSWWGVDMNLCNVGMVQTVSRHLDEEPTPRLIITDENHHCMATGYRRIYEKWPDAYMFGITATPERLDGQGLKDINDDLVIGPSAAWLIDNHYLAPEDYYTFGIISGGRIRMGDFDPNDVKITAAEQNNVAKTYLDLAEGRKAVCYMPTVKKSIEMAETFKRHGIPAEHFDGTTAKAERDSIIERFRSGETMILCNVDLISEGFDVPDCSCSMLCRPTQSLTLHIQQSMRCMRYQPNKTAIILDFVRNVNRHGLPDQDRVWTLEGKKRKGRICKEAPVKTCPDCYRTVPANVAICPECGFKFEARKRMQQDLALELHKVDKAKIQTNYFTLDMCTSYSDLLKYAAQRGYKRGWAYYQAKARGWWVPY